jgi:Uma2 family endonuclease
MELTARQRRIIDPIRETDIPPFPVRKFTVAEYHKMLQVGIFRSGDPYELLKGWIVPKIKGSPPNAYATTSLHHSFWEMFPGDEWVVGCQWPITFRDSEPEPACSLIRGPDEPYKRRHPRPQETQLVAEVADVSLEKDQGVKLKIYATGWVPAYWIVNLVDRRIEVYTEPRGGKNPAYKKHTNYSPEDAVPVVVAGKELGRIAVKELLP